jgi:hypothetical protein
MKHRHPTTRRSRGGVGRNARRPLSILVALLGTISFGAGLSLVVQGAATAAPSVVVCHATNSDTNPYNGSTPDVDSTKFKGHLAHRNSPVEHWKSDGWWNGVYHHKGDAKRDYIASYTDKDGNFHALDGNITLAFCNAPVIPYVVVDGTLTVTQATCATPTASWTTSGAHITFVPPSGTVTPDVLNPTPVTSVGTADTADGYAFAGGAPTKTFTGTVDAFDPAACAPVVKNQLTPSVTFTPPTCAAPAGSWVGSDTADIDYTESIAGSTITVTATLKDAKTTAFAPGAQTVFTNTHWGAPTGCVVPKALSPSVTFTDPTCTAPAGSWHGTDPTLIGYSVSVVGSTITVTASLIDAVNYVLAPGATTTFSHTWTTPTSCGSGNTTDAHVTPAVTFKDPTCTTDGSWTGVHEAKVNYAEAVSGKVVTVTATPAIGYAFPAGAKTVFSHTWAQKPGCGAGGGDDTDVAIPTAVHSGMDSLAPTAVGRSDGGVLVAWGSGLAALGVVLFGAGVFTGRRREVLA